MYHYETCGLTNIYLKNGVQKRTVGGEEYVSIIALDSLHEAIGANIASYLRPLTGEEVRFLRIELDMSQKALGLILDKTDQAIAKWEKNETPIPRSDDVCLRTLYLESRHKDSKFTELLNRFNEIDRETRFNVVFEEAGDHWDKVALLRKSVQIEP